MKKIDSSFRKMVLIGILVLIINPVLFVQAEGGSSTIDVTDDAYTDVIHPKVNYGGELTLKVNVAGYITWLKFDLSSIPEGAEGITAIMELYTAADGVTAPHSVDVWLLQNDFNNTWTEGTITYANSPPVYTSLLLDTEYVTDNETRYEWNVTGAVVAALDYNSTAFTIFMRYPFGAEAVATSFQSKEGAHTWTRIPKLTVLWDAIIPEYSPFIVPIAVVTTLAVIFLRGKAKRVAMNHIHNS